MLNINFHCICCLKLFLFSFVEIVNTHQFQMKIINDHLHISPNIVQIHTCIATILFPTSDLNSYKDCDHAYLFLSHSMPSFLDQTCS